MSAYTATSVGIVADTQHGEGWVVFRWPHDLYGYEELSIHLDGHCSRRMPLHSGEGPPEIVALRRDSIRLRFGSPLAAQLEFPNEIEILFRLSDEEFSDLRRVVEYFTGGTESP